PARAASRGAMRDALAAGPPEARPTQLAAPGLDLEAPVYPLRGFEQAEARFLARGGRHEPPLSHLPVALWTPERDAEIGRHVPLDRLLPDPPALAQYPPAPPATAFPPHLLPSAAALPPQLPP